MDEPTYQQWWPLHLRASKGEVLEAEEQAFYEAGLCHLHRDETIRAPAALTDLEEKIAAAELKNVRLEQQRELLERRLNQLQSRSTGQPFDSSVRNP